MKKNVFVVLTYSTPSEVLGVYASHEQATAASQEEARRRNINSPEFLFYIEKATFSS